MQTVECDYLIIGGGAMGMAFADTLLSETDATIAIVDRHHQPGGHWNDAYPYVRLHQPSAFYGVNSRRLGSDQIDSDGFNQGLYELATNSEVLAYFDQVMQQQFIPSGRVQYFPGCDYKGDGTFQSLLSGKRYQSSFGKLVNATYMNVTVPSVTRADFPVAAGVAFEPPNALPGVQGQFDHFTVIGAGKTGMDACLFLLRNGVDPGAITWIMPRDAWMLDRANIQPGKFFTDTMQKFMVQQGQIAAEAADAEDLFARLEDIGALIRLDSTRKPTMYRCATVTRSELAALRQIEDIVRLGRVTEISASAILLEEGTIPTSTGTLHINCTADGLQSRKPVPVFDGPAMTLQSVRTCQQVFSAAFIAHVEAGYDDDALKNELCRPVPHPNTDIDFIRTSLENALNTARWSEDRQLQAWLKQSRLDGFSQADAPDPDMSDPDVVLKLQQAGATLEQSIRNLRRILQDQQTSIPPSS